MLYHNNDFKKIIRHFAVIIFALVVLDFAIGTLLKIGYFKQKAGTMYLATIAIDSTRASCLVFGASHAAHNYVSPLFENRLHATFYNCGRDACDMIYSLAIASAITERYTPQHIILDLSADELSRNEEGKLSVLLPYAGNKTINSYLLKYNGPYEGIKQWSKLYPVNSMLWNIVTGDLSLSHQHNINGYLPLHGSLAFSPVKELFPHPVIPVRQKLLDDFLSKMQQKHIPVTLVISPSFFTAAQNASPATFKMLAKKYNIRFFN